MACLVSGYEYKLNKERLTGTRIISCHKNKKKQSHFIDRKKSFK